MVVRADSSVLGTIGGGLLEATAIKLAQEVLRSRQPIIQAFDLTGRDVSDMDMICGGKGELLLDYIDAADSNNLLLYQEAAGTLEKRSKAWLITALDTSCQTRQQCLVKADRSMVGVFQCEASFLERLISGPAKISIHADMLVNQRVLVEPICHPGTVYIFGAGHVSQKIAPLTDMVGFSTVVLDDRREFANRQRFPEPIEVMLLDNYETLPDMGVGRDSYIVIVTRGHLHDKTVLEWALRTPAGYIGMIGSRKKREAIYAALMQQGFTREELSRVYSPIGVNIEAETPEEIAVSIAGELIKVRAEQEKWAAN